MKPGKTKAAKLKRRIQRTRAKILGTEARPRLSVFRSNYHLYAQLIDDAKKRTICAISDKEINKNKVNHITVAQAKELGVELAKKAREKGIKQVVFDRGGYRYHGRVKSLADGARENGLEF